ncbi:hypothetical protein Bequi_00235 [Brachybacterium sp. JHP9]|uniref:Lysyl-tRNA synthetase n=1 Tax=Brachybacterium equifaecis TaxID=2910770 RepID=A0ABT0QXE6_9MICO|nr:hypothetical protein [Brachybacterium equifaecis]MCL6421823.1 hypothetical protein [Brachybacterium equifaecis]
MGSGFWYEAGSLVPSIGVGLLFWFAMRAILRADRREREAERLADRELRLAQRAAGENRASSPGAAGEPANAPSDSDSRGDAHMKM